MRFFSSSALASAPKLRLAASCSAAETMFGLLSLALSYPAGRSAGAGHYLALALRYVHVCGFANRPQTRAMTQMLRRLAFFLCRGRQNLHRAAGPFDRGNCGFRRAMDFDIDPGLDFATAEQPNAIFGATQHARFHQCFGGDRAGRVELLGIDCLLQPIEVDLDEFEPEDVVETALGQAPVQRHLAALEALDAHAGTRGLALAAATRSLALA